MTTTQINWTKGQLASYVGIPGANGLPASTAPPVCASTPGQQGTQGASGTDASPAQNGMPGVQSPTPTPASIGSTGTNGATASNGSQGPPYPYIKAALYSNQGTTNIAPGGTTLSLIGSPSGQIIINVPGDVPFIMRGAGTVTSTAPMGSMNLSNGSGVSYYYFKDTQITVSNFPFFMISV